MRFILTMAGRELRASWRRLLFFFLCIAIGVGAIVALRSVIQNVHSSLAGEARSLTAGDVLIQSNRAWSDEALARIAGRVAEVAAVRTDAIDTVTMLRPAAEAHEGVRMVEVRGVQAGHPLHGTLELESERPYSHELLRGGGMLVRPELLAQLGLSVGDAVVIGTGRFTIRGVITLEPGRRIGAFAFGTPVLVDYDDLLRTGLITFGSRAVRQIRLQVPEPAAIEPLVRRLREDLQDEFVTVRSYRGLEDRMGDDLRRAEDYLSLVGLVMVVLGGIGVWSVTRVFIAQKLRTIAILKCLGASSRQVLAIHVVQVLLLGLAGSLLGVALAAAALAAVPPVDAGAMTGVAFRVTPSAVAQGLGIGMLVSLLFSLVPLLGVRHIKPLMLLRQTVEAGSGSAVSSFGSRIAGLKARLAGDSGGVDWLRMAAIVLVAGGLVVVAGWQAGSWRVGFAVSMGFALAALALHGAGLMLVRAVAPLAASRWFPLRHAVVNLRRPGNQTRVILLAVGLGAFFIIGVRSLQVNLLQTLEVELRADAPDMFLIDIQQDQAAGVQALLEERLETPPRLLPVLRARVTGVEGRTLRLQNVQEVRERGGLGREYVITYRSHLERNERILEGEFWDDSPGRDLEVSIERNLRDRTGLQVGDRVRFDILGRTVEARVTSVRHVDWDDSRSGGFMFVFRPGPLDDAPHGYIAMIKAPDGPAARADLQRSLVSHYPNVSAIDVREIIATIRGVVDNVTLAISIVGLVALLSGALILVGAVAMTKFQRVYEAAIFRTLGASARMMGLMLLLEYGTLGLLAGAVGASGAMVLTWAVTTRLLDIPWQPAPLQALAGVAITGTVVAAVGVLVSLEVLRHKPLVALRAE
jgi:putative ABC transport system permease protein